MTHDSNDKCPECNGLMSEFPFGDCTTPHVIEPANPTTCESILPKMGDLNTTLPMRRMLQKAVEVLNQPPACPACSEEIEKLKAERDQLRTENERLKLLTESYRAILLNAGHTHCPTENMGDSECGGYQQALDDIKEWVKVQLEAREALEKK